MLLALQALRGQYFNRFADLDPKTRGGITVERMFDSCSYNKLLFKEANQVIDSAFMPCSGKSLIGLASPVL